MFGHSAGIIIFSGGYKMSYVIAVASTADLPYEYLKEHDIPFIRYGYTMDGKSYEDDCKEETKANIYAQMR